MTKETEILVAFFVGRVDMLIPKKRGGGFLKVPLGHHHNGLSRVAMNTQYDVTGLDGALEIEIGRCHSIMEKDRPEFLKRSVEPLANYLGFPYRVVDHNEYWAKHPTAEKGSDAHSTFWK